MLPQATRQWSGTDMKSAKKSNGVLSACKPRKEVLEGELDDAIFAADFGQLVDGSAPKVYGHAETFFRNTEPTPDLKAVCTTVFKALADKKEAGQLIRLSTGFGGGKTHTLMALWHLGLMSGHKRTRAVRALRILVETVK
jgi:predicted AAA+ superfamily ATPase